MLVCSKNLISSPTTKLLPPKKLLKVTVILSPFSLIRYVPSKLGSSLLTKLKAVVAVSGYSIFSSTKGLFLGYFFITVIFSSSTKILLDV